MMNVMMRLNEQARAKAEAEGENNKTKGAEFLAVNAQRPEVNTTGSGLQYEVIEAGDVASRKPTAASTVEVRYVGTLIDGTEFDRSRDDQTVRFPVGGVIPGWTEGLQLMNVGSKFRFFIPSALAYGERPLPGIGPNSTLIFEVELVNIID
jgi:FKBP-type peptidyl-prolyl cis-trans isomerase